MSRKIHPPIPPLYFSQKNKQTKKNIPVDRKIKENGKKNKNTIGTS